MDFVRTPVIFEKILKKILWRYSSDEKIIYLTFDDGPTPGITEWILEELAFYNAKATFFCTGTKAEKHSELIEKINSEGHSVGNHTYNHLNGWKTKTEKYILDVGLATMHINSNLFRPPYGKIKLSQLRQISKNYKIVMWDVSSKDYDGKISGQQCADNVIKNSKKGSIILFHDTFEAKENMKTALPIILQNFQKKGYCFSAIK